MTRKGVGLTPGRPLRFVLGGPGMYVEKMCDAAAPLGACICDEHFNIDKSRCLERAWPRSMENSWWAPQNHRRTLNRQRGRFRSAKTKACRRHAYANARSIDFLFVSRLVPPHRVRRSSRSLERQPVIRERRLLQRCAQPALGRRLANARKLFVAGATAASRIARAASLTLRQDARHARHGLS
jgi:hypothetical protein